jgi:hypothetical protein
MVDEYLIGCKVITDYYDNEIFEIVNVRENEFELRGDWSGGTHNVCQTSWYPSVKCKLILPETEWVMVSN